MEKILVINPGSTSTKIAVFDGESELFRETVEHSDDELAAIPWIMDQLGFRTECVLNALKRREIAPGDLDCVMARGGMLPPCGAGAYEVNDDMVAYMMTMQHDAHASNVGCAIANSIARPLGIPAYIYDPVVVDELAPLARITGLPDLPKRSRGHALNSRAMARRCAGEVMQKPLSECTLIVQHIGGGTSVWLFHKGKAIDMYSDDDAGFAPERCGKLQAMPLVKMCFSGGETFASMAKRVRGNAGFRAHLGTADMREVERMVNEGNEHAALIFDAFIYGIAKGIGDLATVVCGKVDRIVLTGGVAHSQMLVGKLRERIEWIAPVVVMAGEHEMEALAMGGLRMMRGQERANPFELRIEN